MNRWERMKELFELFEKSEPLSCREISNELNININHSDSLLRGYCKQGYLKRRKNLDGRYIYIYVLTRKGYTQLNGFLKTGMYQNYLLINQN